MELLSLNLEQLGGNEAKELFFKILAFPLQGFCRVLKRFGGRWITREAGTRQVDGDKFVCLDKMLRRDPGEQCIIYSFGIADDWSFEDQISTLLGELCKLGTVETQNFKIILK